MQQAILTVDLGFGDAGKGSIVDYLARRHDAHTVVRYNGGAQAGHRVVTPGAAPQEHVFAQFGSGALAGAATHLSRFMLLDPLAMMVEAQHLRELGAPDPFAHTTIDAGALVITPFQRAANRLKELARGAGRHGSCGMGIGETQAWVHEGGAEALSLLALRESGLWADEQVVAHAQSLVAECRAAEAKRAADPATEATWRDNYTCGYTRFADSGVDVFTMWRRLMARTEASGEPYSEAMFDAALAD